MGFALPSFARSTEWTGVDTGSDGRWLAVKVRPPRAGRGKPVVVSCAQSSGVAIGQHAIAELSAKLGGGPWSLPLARDDYQMLVLPEPPVLDSELEQSLRWTLASMVDYPIEQAAIAWMRIPQSDSGEKREKQLYVIVARRSVITEQAEMFSKANVALKAVEVRETALRNIAALLENKNEGVGLVTADANGITTTFTFRGELYLDRFIAQPLQQVLAEDDQRQQRFLDRIAQQVHQSMELLSRNFPFITVGRIVIAAVPGLPIATHLRGKLPVPVEALDLANIADLADIKELRTPELQSRYLVAFGSALRGCLQ